MAEDFSPDEAEFRCLVPFPDQSASFVHGFEAGMIWQRMIKGEPQIGGFDDEIAAHFENAAVFRKMADAQGYDLDLSDFGNGWIIATFTKRPRGFGVIEGGAA